jgi:DNA polymerase elongation subunit (family B)
MKGRKVQLKVFYWQATDENDGTKTVIHVGGRTASNETVHGLIEGFTPYVNVELPTRIAWDKYKAKTFFKHLQAILGKFGPVGEPELYKKSQLHYLKDMYIINMNFPSSEAVRKLTYACNNAKGIYVPGIGQFWSREFKVHEANIDPILKMSAAKNLQLANWIELTELIPEDEVHYSEEERKFTTADIDLKVNWKDIKPIEQPGKDLYITPSYCSFDLECYSKNHNSKMPNPEIPENKVISVSMVFGILDNVESRKHTLISLGEPRKDRIRNCDELIIFETERDLLLGFSKLIRERDPDLFIHYNGMKFDWDYLIKRAELCECFNDFSYMSRVSGKKASLEKKNWSSQAYGEQVFRYLECHGRTNVDVLIEIERNHRLANYRLDTVAERFLGQHKDDVSPRELFMLWDLTHDVYPFVKDKTITPKELIQWRAKVADIFEFRKCTGNVVKVYREELMKSSTKEFAEKCREAMEIVGTYCIQDTILPVELIEKLNIWKSMEAMSNVTHVPVAYLHTRGQQIKVLSQVYRETIPKDMIIPTFPKSDKIEKYEGATVIEANAGDYTNVATLDFASLYPTVMIAFNISYDTILEDDDPTPDSECHVLEFKSHVGCEHDEKKRKKKAEDVICKDYRYRFRKVKYHIDKKGNVRREHEGVMPRLERNLMASRKVAKKEMAKVEALLKTHYGTATEDDIKFYTKMAWRMVGKGELGKNEAMMAEINFNTLNANQLALKVSCNSVGGNTPIPCLVDGQFRYLAIEALFSKDFTVDDDGNELCNGPQNIQVWSDKGWADIKYVIRHEAPKVMHRVLTSSGCVDVSADHSLLNEFGKEVKATDLDYGDKLLHISAPLPEDTPARPLISADRIKDIPKPVLIFELIDKYLSDKYENRLWFFLLNLPDLEKGIRGSLNASRWYYFLKSLGYSVTINRVLGDVHFFGLSENTLIETCVKAFVDFTTTPGEYIYDIETSTHHFAAGVGDMIVHNSAYGCMGVNNGMLPLIAGAASVTAMGRRLIMMAIDRIKKEYPSLKLVYGDTDSCMIHFTGKSLDEAWGLAEQASKIATHAIKCYIVGVPEDYTIGPDKIPIAKYTLDTPGFKDLPYKDQCHVLDYQSCPIDLEFENFYGRYLLLTKKRYVAYSVNRKGDLLGITKKGVVLTRRDNSRYLRDTYESVVTGILDNISEQNVMYKLYDRIQLLFTRQITAQQLIIYMGIKSIINYAKSKKEKKGRNIISQVPIDKHGVIIDDVIGPLDPRLVYPNLPQVLLALKMMRRGEDIPPNTRLEFLYLLTKGWTHQGQKAEDYTYYKEFKDIENLRPDYLHYIEKQLAKPITELISVKFKKGFVPFIPIEDKFRECIGALPTKHRVQVARQTSYIKSRPPKKIRYDDDEEYIGWEVLKVEGYERDREDYKNLAKDKPFQSYISKKLEAQATYVLDQIKSLKYEEEDSISKEKYPDFYNLCTWYKSVELINKLYKAFGIKKRKWIRPTRSADRLEANVDIVMISVAYSEEGVNKGDIGTILQRIESGDKKDPVYSYSIMIGDNETHVSKVIKNVPRKAFTTYTVKDGKVMDNIFDYRTYYTQVVRDIKDLGSMVTIIQDDEY